MESDHDFNSLLIDLLLKHIDLFIVSNSQIAKIAVPLEKALDSILKEALGETRHH